MKIFVAGGAGFIGSNFIRHLLLADPKIKILNYDKLTYSGNLDNLRGLEKKKNYLFVRGDITNNKKLTLTVNKFKPDFIINFAAETHVDRSIHVGAKEFINTNVMGVFNFLELVKANSYIKNYLQVSTDEVYGSLPLTSKKLFTEETPFAPNIPYSATKAGGDMLCRAYFQTFKVPVTVTHASNNYGPYQYPEKLIPFFITQAIEGKPLPLYGNGRNVRDWLHVLDHCEALRLILLKGKPGEVYNIGADNERTNLEIAERIIARFKESGSRIVFVADRPGHDLRYAINASKIRRELGWRPKYSFISALDETITWYVKNPRWIKRVRERTGVFNPHIDLWKGHKIK